MSNLTAFLGTFSAYLILFLVFVAVVVAATFVGITARKIKNRITKAKEEMIKE